MLRKIPCVGLLFCVLLGFYSVGLCCAREKINSVSEKKFSIIIPIYNTEKYLSECIDSAINQSYKNIEIVLVNDGSQGNADEICKRYLKKDKRIRYLQQKNQGVAIARNNGIAISSGDFIFCMDSDDTMEKEFIEKIIDVFERESCDCVVVGDQFCKIPSEIRAAVPTCGIAVTRDILQKYPDIRYQERMQPCEDGLFSHKLMALTDKIGLCKSAKYFYRSNPESSEHNLKTKQVLRDIPVWLSILEDFYTKYNLWDTKKLYLLAFIEGEPFVRFGQLQCSMKEKKVLFDCIHEFIKKHKLNNIEYAKRFSKVFYRFVMSNSFYIFMFYLFTDILKSFIF